MDIQPYILPTLVTPIVVILVIQAIQGAVFSYVLSDAGVGNYTTDFLSLKILSITNEKVSLEIERDNQICNLKERESCYSGCVKIEIADIKNNTVDVDLTDEIFCEVKINAYNFGNKIRKEIISTLNY